MEVKDNTLKLIVVQIFNLKYLLTIYSIYSTSIIGGLGFSLDIKRPTGPAHHVEVAALCRKK
jgi:hypothetical protein